MPLNYAGPHGELAGGSMDRRFFHKLGASLLARGELCGLVRGSAYTSLYGTVPGMPPEQMRYSDLSIVWGNNVTVSNLHLTRMIKAARVDKGAKLIVIDPKRTRIAEQADLFIQIRPGTDVVLALAMAAELERRGSLDTTFIEKWVDGYETYMENARTHTPEMAVEICGIDRDDFDRFAEWYSAGKIVGVSVGNGLERGHSGGSGIRAAMALQVLTGNHGQLGAGVFAKPGNSFPKSIERLQRPDLVPEGTRTINNRRHFRGFARQINGSTGQGGVHLQPQSSRHTSRPESDAPGSGPGGSVHCGCRRGDDGFHGLLRRGSTGGKPFRIRRYLWLVRPSLSAKG